MPSLWLTVSPRTMRYVQRNFISGFLCVNDIRLDFYGSQSHLYINVCSKFKSERSLGEVFRINYTHKALSLFLKRTIFNADSFKRRIIFCGKNPISHLSQLLLTSFEAWGRWEGTMPLPLTRWTKAALSAHN